ncbi:uncharacterized protein LOC123272648 [Cotesia glomerata]|uniref:uncharacterized protein LOC123272648 n=1 Tax=Cotesia glomerata TaxID=32391 RepID=UPI001D02BA95|nr:uncharacterized protein LOC123272648 [Cotesia glomerata]
MSQSVEEISRKRCYDDRDNEKKSSNGNIWHSSPIIKRIKLEKSEESERFFYCKDVEAEVKQELYKKIKDDPCSNNNNNSCKNETINSLDEGIHIYDDETLIIEDYDVFCKIRSWASNAGVTTEDLMKLLDILRRNGQASRHNASALFDADVTQPVFQSSPNEFEKKILEELKNIKKSQEKTLRKLTSVYNNQSIEPTQNDNDNDDDIRCKWFSEYNIYLPINKIETFNQFDKFLIETEQFRTKFMSFIDVIIKPDKCLTMSRKISAVLKKMMVRDVVIQFTMMRPKPDRTVMSKTKYYDCLYDYFYSNQLEFSEKTSQSESKRRKPKKNQNETNKKYFASAFRAAISNSKDWDDHRTKGRQSL